MAYNFARRLKTLKGLTPYEYVCKIWTNEPERFNVNSFQHTMGLNKTAGRELIQFDRQMDALAFLKSFDSY
jgi:hypothetical protein